MNGRRDGSRQGGIPRRPFSHRAASPPAKWARLKPKIVTLTDEQFLEVVVNGRLGMRGPMPVFGHRMSLDDIWKVHAFIKSRDRF